jgi:N-acetylglucosamine kinase-like BadF-type ATPase
VTVVLGIDGGGTKTHAVVADAAGTVLGFATSGPANWEVVGLRGAGESLREAARRALRAAGADVGDIVASVFGLAGVDWDSDLPRMTHEVEQLGLPGPAEVTNDSFIALRAGTDDGMGVVVIAGTGAITAGRSRDGRTFRTLGQGAEFGDTGSASDVSDAALRAVANAYTGRGPQTELTELLCSLYGCRSAAELLERASRGGERSRSAAPTVLRSAEGGDEVARGIVHWAGCELGQSAVLSARQLGMTGERFDVVLAGGLFRGESALLLDTLAACVHAEAPHARLVVLDTAPVAGAALMALDASDGGVSAPAAGRLRAGVLDAVRARAGAMPPG